MITCGTMSNFASLVGVCISLNTIFEDDSPNVFILCLLGGMHQIPNKNARTIQMVPSGVGLVDCFCRVPFKATLSETIVILNIK